MGNNFQEGLIDATSRQRLLFPSWIDPEQRRRRNRRVQVLRKVVSAIAVTIIFWAVCTILQLCLSRGTDAVLGRKIPPDVASAIGLPPSSDAVKGTLVAANNPWRGASRRRRNDLITSVPGCGGTIRPSLKRGDIASLYYQVRSSNGTIDSTRESAPVDVVLGSNQISKEVEGKLEGLCAGEAVAFRTAQLSYLVYINRVGPLRREDQETAKLEKLAHILTQIGASRGISCQSACRRIGLDCANDAFRIINSCPRLRKTFRCRACEVAAAGSSGPDMPCYVEMTAPQGHPRGFCMVNPKVDSASCEAKYMHTRRLCPCVSQKDLPS